MKSKNIKRGRVVTPADANPWPHEQKVAKVLALAGHYVEFIPETNLKTPDIYLGNTIYEIKSPITDNPKKIIRNVKRALEKSPNVIIDSSRVKGLKDEAIQRALKNKVKDLPGLRSLLFINKRGQIMLELKKIVNTSAFDKIVINTKHNYTKEELCQKELARSRSMVIFYQTLIS